MTTQQTRLSGKSDFIVPSYKLPSGLGLPVGSHMFGVNYLRVKLHSSPPPPTGCPGVYLLSVSVCQTLFLCLSVAPGLKLSTCEAGYPLTDSLKLERFGVGFMYLRGVYTSSRRLRTKAVEMPSKRNKRNEAPLPLVKWFVGYRNELRYRYKSWKWESGKETSTKYLIKTLKRAENRACMVTSFDYNYQDALW